MAKEKTDKIEKVNVQELIDSVKKDINPDDDVLFSEVTDYISTQSPLLDYIIGTKGIPCGRLTDLEGMESSGKSLLILHLIAETQKRNGVAVLVDSEHKFNIPFAQKIGVDTDKVIPIQPDTLEEAFTKVDEIIDSIREKDPDVLILIAVDSLTALPSIEELEADFDKSHMAIAARRISQAIKKLVKKIAKERIAVVTVSHLKFKMGAVAWGEKYVASGGLAPKYYSSLRMRFVKMSHLKDKGGKVIGVQVKLTTVKNHLNDPYKEAELYIYFSKGIDRDRSYVDCAIELGIVKKTGAWYSIGEGENESKFHMDSYAEIDAKYGISKQVDEVIYK